MITFGSNPISRTIQAGTRVMLTGKTVFRVTHLNDFEYNGIYTGAEGIIKILVLQTTLINDDDLTNNIAWNENSEGDVTHPPITIVGDNNPMLGSKKIYDAADNPQYRHWEIECSSELKKRLVFETPGGGNKHCEFKFPSDVRFVGEVIKLKLFVSNTLKDTLDITLKGL
ncbi:hypothetical protein [Clostridium sp.]|uniref:hypothetical protein n=1 Tax=Clostridium sp. TaxID=1506 RepID=UPI003F6629A3